MLSLLMMVSMMPLGATFASTEDGEEASSEVTLTEESVEPTESTEPEESEPDEEPEDTTYANSISGVLWLDMFDDIENSIYAGDGTRQAEESPLAGYRVELYKADDTDNAIATTTTSANGRYSFENIEPGSYVVGVKTTTMDGVEYLLPLFWLDGTTGDNRFVATYDEAADAYLYAYTKSIEVQADSEITGMDAGMRMVPEIQPMADYTIDMSTVSAAGTGYTYSSNVLTFTTAANSHTYTITGTTTTKRIVVNTGVTLNVILDNASITNSTVSPFQLNGTAKVNLTLEGNNTLTCSSTATTLGINRAGLSVPSGTSITIDGSGTLTATAGTGGAGIGGGSASAGAGGTIIINSGTITANGGGPGIGGVFGAIITINGGTVTAMGASGCAGIGGAGTSGFDTVGGTITITGGRVTAIAGAGIDPNPGIGGFTNTTVTFTGGSIYAVSVAGQINTTSSVAINNFAAVAPIPTNGSTYGAPDVVSVLTFPGYSDGDAFFIMAGGTKSSYPYNAIAHPDGNVYAWLVYPGVSTDPATNVTANSATMNGTYYMNGTTISSAYFEWGTSTSYGNTKTLTTPTNITSGVIESVSDNLTGLTSNTTYHYRLVITVGSITVPGNDITFTTKPVVDTLTAASTGASTATISGTIAAGNASISDVIITYATDAGFTANVVTLDGSSGVTFTDTTYTANITGLTSGQTYYVKVEAVGLGGTSDAKTGSFLAGGNPVTEKFVNLSGSAVDSTGLPDNTVIVTGSYTASGIPTSHTVSGDTYTYIGYKLDSYTAGDTLTSGTPSSVAITGNRDVYYVYAIAEGSIKVEKYDHDGTTLLPGAEFKLEKLTDTIANGGVVDTSFTAQTLTATSGTATFSNLPAGVYQISESKAPAGYYLLAEPFEVVIPYDITLPSGQTPTDTNYLYSTTDSVSGDITYHYYNVTYKVSDQAAINMPAAGTTGTIPPYTLYGGLIILIAALGGGILWLKRRRRYKSQH